MECCSHGKCLEQYLVCERIVDVCQNSVYGILPAVLAGDTFILQGIVQAPAKVEVPVMPWPDGSRGCHVRPESDCWMEYSSHPMQAACGEWRPAGEERVLGGEGGGGHTCT